MIDPYIAVLLTLAVSIIVALGLIGLPSLLGPKVYSKTKMEPYESGAVPLTPVRRRMAVKFYLVAALFVMFDVEVVFLYPWAIHFRELGMLGFVAATIFLGIVVAGLAYEWKKGALEWN